jgi:hypothetical protein
LTLLFFQTDRRLFGFGRKSTFFCPNGAQGERQAFEEDDDRKVHEDNSRDAHIVTSLFMTER